jgi:3-oxoadipate enol-lactonase
MATINNNLITYQKGSEKNQSIIFIHGFPFDHKMWDLQIDQLKEHYNCFTYDIRGLGRSPVSDGQFTIESFVDDLFELIAEYKLRIPVLCGLSMGGYIALRAIERDEKMFKALILCDTKSEADNNAGKINRANGIKEINSIGAEKFAETFVQKCFAEKFIINNKKEYEEVVSRAKKSLPTGLKGCLLAMAARTDTTDYLSQIKIPVLVLCGEEDKLTTPSVMKAMADKINGSEFHIVPAAGHVTPVENPEFFNAKVKEFLTKLL